MNHLSLLLFELKNSRVSNYASALIMHSCYKMLNKVLSNVLELLPELTEYSRL